MVSKMMTFLIIVLVALFVVLVGVASIHPAYSHLSFFELSRRADAGNEAAKHDLLRQKLLPDIESLQRVVTAVLLVLFVVLSVVTFEWVFGIIISVVVALEYGAVACLDFVSLRANRLYTAYEPHLLEFVQKAAPVLRFIRSATPSVLATTLNSKEELIHLVEGSGNILSSDERKLVTSGLSFETRLVSEIMTPRSVIDSVSKKEHLGPLILDDLHKKGHSRFPVTDGDIDHVVGMLHIHDLLTIDAKRRSTSVEKAMEPRVFYIKEDQTLQHALAAFLKTHHHLFVVVNEFHETVGLLSLEDVIEAMLGREIVDEFDAHEDLRVVAARNPRHNNESEGATNV
jgi:CBS domain containing-hemolysin-like protein